MPFVHATESPRRKTPR